MKSYFFPTLLLITLCAIQLTSAAHWIAGYVGDALDSTSPNGRTLRLYNPSNAQEIFTIIGPSGPAGVSNIYMIDCELLQTPCQVGDTLNLTLTDDATGHLAKTPVQLIVTGNGFDIAPNISINSPTSFSSIQLEDQTTSPENELDLTPASTTQVKCEGTLTDLDQATSIQSVQATLFSPSSSPTDPDDNNYHYTNSTCQVNTSYGDPTQAQFNCTFQIEYYAEPGTWTCQVNATDNYTASTLAQDTSTLNTLLAIGVNSPLEFGEINATEVSDEKTANVTNYGNTPINLTLEGYGATPADGNSMECGETDISINYTKFNLTSSNPGPLTPSQFEALYENLTSTPTTKTFNLNSRQNDLANDDAMNQTFWRVYLPMGVSGPCTGNIVFGATQS